MVKVVFLDKNGGHLEKWRPFKTNLANGFFRKRGGLMPSLLLVSSFERLFHLSAPLLESSPGLKIGTTLDTRHVLWVMHGS